MNQARPGGYWDTNIADFILIRYQDTLTKIFDTDNLETQTALWQTQTADWQVNEVNIVVECSKRFPIPKLYF